ncbi:MAG: four helix bundle protein [bacterium]|nr:four helix bundle protein [bacterium]
MTVAEAQKIRSFTDLRGWQEGHKLVLMVYRVTENFPQKENFALTNQMRRAVVSITSNIAEGFSRFSSKEKHQFYSIAQGSLTELQNQLLISRDIGYLGEGDFKEIAEQTVSVNKLLNGLKRVKLIPNTSY